MGGTETTTGNLTRCLLTPLSSTALRALLLSSPFPFLPSSGSFLRQLRHPPPIDISLLPLIQHRRPVVA
jgi:hypothetical protein